MSLGTVRKWKWMLQQNRHCSLKAPFFFNHGQPPHPNCPLNSPLGWRHKKYQDMEKHINKVKSKETKNLNRILGKTVAGLHRPVSTTQKILRAALLKLHCVCSSLDIWKCWTEAQDTESLSFQMMQRCCSEAPTLTTARLNQSPVKRLTWKGSTPHRASSPGKKQKFLTLPAEF